jgi:hypothetical protein
MQCRQQAANVTSPEEGLARADHDLAQESLVPNFRSGELTNRFLKVQSIPST